ncbi:MAG: ComEC/Rec2 family competence protein [Candidatus Wolfebacteria bacterium]|nr:ComEC/Rec2 family competence protein [Candidatus Wolfebacteria bacterium]
MRIHDIAFYSIFFFLVGVLLASLNLKFLIIILITALLAALILTLHYFHLKPKIDFKKLSFLSLIIVAGALYYFWVNFQMQKGFFAPFDKKISFLGIVSDYPQRGASQKIAVALQAPYKGKILITLKPYPEFNYGDKLNFEGIIKKPEGSYANYLAKNEISAVSVYPKTSLIKTNQGSKIKSVLFSFKEKFVLALQKILPQEEAALASGLTLGERSEFSKNLKDAMSNSGTTHIVALSGYNITVIVSTAAFLFAFYFRKNIAFAMTLIIILGFVLMTGAEASVARAAIMGSVALLGKQIGRIYSFRNAMSVSAFLMILQNPKILAFDIGFQLSFLALMGIAYLSPAIKDFLKLGKEIAQWKEILISTASAQLAVLPILISSFGKFSLLSILANVLILWLIPFTMGVGFFTGFIGFFSYSLSQILGWFLHLFLYYELAIINFFGKIAVPLKISFGALGIIIYYTLLILFVVYIKRKVQRRLNQPRHNFAI